MTRAPERTVKIVGFVPTESFSAVASAMFAAGAGVIGDYDHCCWYTTGTGTFRPGAGSNPTVGTQGKLEQVEEIRFEMVCPEVLAREVCHALVSAHPYEEPAFDIYPLMAVSVGRATALTPQAPPVSEQRAPSQLWFDGGSRGNPGPAAAGFVLRDESGREIEREGSYLDETTNNVAEYSGLITGLKRALQRGARHLDIYSDSELVVRQLTGAYKVKHAGLRPLYDEAVALLGRLDSWNVRHVRRSENAVADAIVNETLDSVISGQRR